MRYVNNSIGTTIRQIRNFKNSLPNTYFHTTVSSTTGNKSYYKTISNTSADETKWDRFFYNDMEEQSYKIKGKIRLSEKNYKKFNQKIAEHKKNHGFLQKLDFDFFYDDPYLKISGKTFLQTYEIEPLVTLFTELIEEPNINEIFYLNDTNIFIQTSLVYKIIPGYWECYNLNSPEYTGKSDELEKKLEIFITKRNIEEINKKIKFDL